MRRLFAIIVVLVLGVSLVLPMAQTALAHAASNIEEAVVSDDGPSTSGASVAAKCCHEQGVVGGKAASHCASDCASTLPGYWFGIVQTSGGYDAQFIARLRQRLRTDPLRPPIA